MPKITKLQLTKSKTIGIVLTGGKTRFNKIVLTVDADLDVDEDKKEAYGKLSDYIEECFLQESKNNN